MLPVHRSNIPLAKECLIHLLNNSEYPIICIDELGRDEDYIIDSRINYIHNNITQRRSLVQIWNQCVKDCPTDNVIIASWRQRPTRETFKIIEEKLNDGYGLVTFDGLHFFGLNKYLTTVIGFFDEGFTKGQYEDTDWFNRLRVNNIAIYVGNVAEQRQINGKYIGSMWLDDSNENKTYYISKWEENVESKTLIQKKNELNFNDRTIFREMKKIEYKTWENSVLSNNLYNYYNSIFINLVKYED